MFVSVSGWLMLNAHTVLENLDLFQHASPLGVISSGVDGNVLILGVGDLDQLRQILSKTEILVL
jgi:hypothetical protein